jgi:cytochrome P450
LLSLEEVAGHAFLVLIGGIDTTTALLSNTFIHLQQHPEERARLLADPQLLDTAFHRTAASPAIAVTLKNTLSCLPDFTFEVQG